MLELRATQDIRAEKLRQYDAAKAAESADAYQSIIGGDVTSDVANRNIVKGEYVVSGGSLFIAIVNIPRGAALVEGMNVTRTNMEEQLNALQERQ